MSAITATSNSGMNSSLSDTLSVVPATKGVYSAANSLKQALCDYWSTLIRSAALTAMLIYPGSNLHCQTLPQTFMSTIQVCKAQIQHYVSCVDEHMKSIRYPLLVTYLHR